MGLEYSYLLTVRNNAHTIVKCLQSIHAQQDFGRVETVVVDSFSTDGTYEILRSYGDSIRLIRHRCTRGTGWNIALHLARAPFVIVIAGDMVLADNVHEKLEIYHESYSDCGFLFRTVGDFAVNLFFIAPTQLMMDIGGWRDLQYFEDWDLWSRLARLNKFRYTDENPFLKEHIHHPSRKNHLNLIKTAFASRYYQEKLGYVPPWRPSLEIPIRLVAHLASHLSGIESDPTLAAISKVNAEDNFVLKLNKMFPSYVRPSQILGFSNPEYDGGQV
jgi:glycosyltransferase involved in cell wall biosynthesis